MTDRQVVAFHEILGQHLPVRAPAEFLAEDLAVVGHRQVADQPLHPRQPSPQGGASGFSVTMIQPCQSSTRTGGSFTSSLQKPSFRAIAGAPRKEPSRL